MASKVLLGKASAKVLLTFTFPPAKNHLFVIPVRLLPLLRHVLEMVFLWVGTPSMDQEPTFGWDLS